MEGVINCSFFSDPSRDVATASRQPILGAKSAKSAYSLSFIALTFRNGLVYHNADGCFNSGNDLATLCEYLVNLGPVTPKFTRVVGVHPLSISTVVSLAMFAWRRHCSTLRRLVLSFMGRSVATFVSPIR